MRITSFIIFFLAIISTSTHGIEQENFYQFKFNDLLGKPITLDTYKGKVLLIVNTASQCGYAYQLGQLQELYKIYGERGFVVMAMPSDDFGQQELNNPFEIQSFAEERFHVTFPLTDIIKVKQPNRHPFYSWVESKLGTDALPQWNFHKYLINRKGELLMSFNSATDPMSAEVIEVIESNL